MNENLRIWNYKSSKFRTVEIEGEPYFVGKDVAITLGYAKPENAIATHVDDEDKTATLIRGTGSNYKSKTIAINESGLYSLILSSKLPNAKNFKRWVTSKVLPELRKNGSYGNNINLEEVIAKTATTVVSEVMKHFMSNKRCQMPDRSCELKRKAKRYKHTQPSKIDTLSPELKEKVDDMIASGKFSCQQIANFIMNNCNMYISQMSVNRYKRMHFIEEDDSDNQMTLF